MVALHCTACLGLHGPLQKHIAKKPTTPNQVQNTLQKKNPTPNQVQWLVSIASTTAHVLGMSELRAWTCNRQTTGGLTALSDHDVCRVTSTVKLRVLGRFPAQAMALWVSGDRPPELSLWRPLIYNKTVALTSVRQSGERRSLLRQVGFSLPRPIVAAPVLTSPVAAASRARSLATDRWFGKRIRGQTPTCV